MSAPEPASPSDELANLVLALLAPMFLWATAGDLRLAYTAAAHTLNEYRIANRLSIFAVAKIIAFDIATLSSLSQSMYEDVSIPLALRLRGNANSLDRSGERSRLRLDQERRTGTVSTTSVEADIAEAQRMVREANARIRAAAQAPEPSSRKPAPLPRPNPPHPPLRRLSRRLLPPPNARTQRRVSPEPPGPMRGKRSRGRSPRRSRACRRMSGGGTWPRPSPPPMRRPPPPRRRSPRWPRRNTRKRPDLSDGDVGREASGCAANPGDLPRRRAQARALERDPTPCRLSRHPSVGNLTAILPCNDLNAPRP